MPKRMEDKDPVTDRSIERAITRGPVISSSS